MNYKKLLIFETSNTIAKAYELSLKHTDYSLVRVLDNDDLANQIEKFKPDLAIIEQKSIDSTTIDLLQTSKIPFAVSLHSASKEQPISNISISRPFSTDELFSTLEKLFDYAEKNLSSSVESDDNFITEDPFAEDDEPVVIEPIPSTDMSEDNQPFLLTPETDNDSFERETIDDTESVRKSSEEIKENSLNTDNAPDELLPLETAEKMSEENHSVKDDSTDIDEDIADNIPLSEEDLKPDVSSFIDSFDDNEKIEELSPSSESPISDASEDNVDTLTLNSDTESTTTIEKTSDVDSLSDDQVNTTEVADDMTEELPDDLIETTEFIDETDDVAIVSSDISDNPSDAVENSIINNTKVDQSDVSESIDETIEAPDNKTTEITSQPIDITDDITSHDESMYEETPPTGTDKEAIIVVDDDLIDISSDFTPSSALNPEDVKNMIRKELQSVMKEIFWEEAPDLIQGALEKQIHSIAEKM